MTAWNVFIWKSIQEMSHLSIDTFGTVESPEGAQQKGCKVKKSVNKNFLLTGYGLKLEKWALLLSFSSRGSKNILWRGKSALAFII